MIVVDASALIAVIAAEPDALDLIDCLQSDRDRTISALGAWETMAGLRRSYAFPPDVVRERIHLFLKALDIGFAPIGEREFEIAATAYEAFGKGRHPAALNMGDCFAYACAKANNASLLFKGDDFTKTDIEPALSA